MIYAEILKCIETRSKEPHEIERMISEALKLESNMLDDAYVDDASKTTVRVTRWVLPDNSIYHSIGGPEASVYPPFLHDMDVARSLVPDNRRWLIEETPGDGAVACVTASATHDGPGYNSVRLRKPAAALTHAALKARNGMNIF